MAEAPPIKTTNSEGKVILNPGVSHETPRRSANSSTVLFTDASDEFVVQLAEKWWNEHGLDVLMVWAQGNVRTIKSALSVVLGRNHLSTNLEPRLDKALTRLMNEAVSK